MLHKMSKGLFDIPVEFACPYCGNPAKVELARVHGGSLNVVCRSCPAEFHPNDEQTTRALIEHGNNLTRCAAASAAGNVSSAAVNSFAA
jgi:hypothetical protein